MEERIIIQGKKLNVKIISAVILLIGVFVFITVWSIETSNGGFYEDCIADGDWSYVLTSMVPYFGAMTILPFAVITGVFYAWSSKISLTVTNRRVYGKAAFGKRVDLPMDMISAVGTGMFKSIAVTTSSGAIKFAMMANNNDIHAVISNLLLERQNTNQKNNGAIVTQNIQQSSADELKKYKELLDSGVISQEEFDAKKKQLLGV